MKPMPVPHALPSVSDWRAFRDNPLKFLEQARNELGNVFALRNDGPILSETEGNAGTLAIFGNETIRIVLSDIDLYGMPPSGARRLGLPANLVNLNSSLQGRSGEDHRRQSYLLFQVLNENTIQELKGRVWDALERFGQTWRHGKDICLLSEMRELTGCLASCLLFEDRPNGHDPLPLLLRTYFQLRREATAPFSRTGLSSRQDLIIMGEGADAALRHCIDQTRQKPNGEPRGILRRMIELRSGAAAALSDDEMVGHVNVMFISIAESIAVALTWTLLVLSQLPQLRSAIRRELSRTDGGDAGSFSPLLDWVIKESLRILPPNAVTIRVTSRAATLGRFEFPSGTEIVLCPFLNHREPGVFHRPSAFLPLRWKSMQSSPFDYHPFGAGGRVCAGRRLATHLIRTALRFLLSRYDLVLHENQRIDWCVDIVLTPRPEPIMQVRTATESALAGGNLCGPISDLVDLKASVLDMLNVKFFD